VALDVHKHYLVVGAVDAQPQVVLPPRRVDLERFAAWAPQHLTRQDAVVLEATTNTWELYDQLPPHVAAVTVAHPWLVGLISKARVKTDAADTLHLARLLAAGLLPAVGVPPVAGRELRGLLAQRPRRIRQRTQARNRLHRLLHRHALLPPAGDPFAAHNRAWWDALTVSPVERLRLRQDWQTLVFLQPLIDAAEAEVLRLSTPPPWADSVAFLVQLPGFGVLNAMTVLGAVGDITRFPSAKHLVGYTGLGAGVHDSGQTHRDGKITKQGRRDLRFTLVEAAWTAVQTHPHWQAQFEQLTRRMPKGQAIVALARKLAVALWHVLTDRQADCHADASQVARKLLAWAEQLDAAGRHGLSTGAFIRQELDRLHLGPALTAVSRGPTRQVPLPPSPLPVTA